MGDSGDRSTAISTKWQAAWFARRAAPSHGSSVAQIVRSGRCRGPTGQRGWKRHPVGGIVGVGRFALDRPSIRAEALIDRAGHGVEEDLGERVLGRGEHVVGAADLDDLAEVHHGDDVADVAHDGDVVADEQHRQCRARRATSRTTLRIDPCTDTSSDDVISSAISSRGSAARARAIETRCSCPPDSCRGSAASTAGSRETSSSSRADLGAALDAVQPAADGERFGHRLADGHPRIERGVRVLEHHLHAPPSLTGGPIAAGDVLAVQGDRSRRPARPSPTIALASVDLPEPDSPTSPTTPPAGTSRLTSSTATIPSPTFAVANRHVADRQQAHSWATASSRERRLVASADASRRPATRRRAGRAWGAPSGSGRRRTGNAARRRSRCRPRGGRAAGRGSSPAADRGRSSCRGRRRRAPACTGGRRRRAPSRRRPPRRCARAYITTIRPHSSATAATSWEMSSTDAPSSRFTWRKQVEDLPLDGDVEGGRRFVGDVQLGLCPSAPWRSPPAASCRRTARAG